MNKFRKVHYNCLPQKKNRTFCSGTIKLKKTKG